MLLFTLRSGSCHLDRASNVEIGVEYQIFAIVIFFNCSPVLQFGAHSRYYKGGLTQESIFSNLYYFQICFSCQQSKQIFNTKFVIRNKPQQHYEPLILTNPSFLMIYNIKKLKISIAELPSLVEGQIKTNCRQWIAERRGLQQTVVNLIHKRSIYINST